MIKNLKAKYERLIDDLSRETDERYKQYLISRPRTLVHQNLIFDLEHLDSYYDCQGCRQKKRKAFCCADHDLELTDRDIAEIEKLLPAACAAFPGLARQVREKGFWEWGEDFERVMRKKKSGECVFLMPGAGGCYLHAWALSAGRDPFEVKPYVCALYPLAVILIGDEVVVTTVNRVSAKILDCGNGVHPCAQKRGKKENHTLVQSRAMLVRMFGEQVYKIVCDRAPGND